MTDGIPTGDVQTGDGGLPAALAAIEARIAALEKGAGELGLGDSLASVEARIASLESWVNAATAAHPALVEAAGMLARLLPSEIGPALKALL
jgi:hypothetical protein